MADFVDPTVIAQINGAKDELIAEVAKISNNSATIEAYADSLSNPTLPEAPIDGELYGRQDASWVQIPASGGGDAVWGSITGTLSDQTDLQGALDAKADSSSLATVATTGAYADLTGKPSIIAEAPIDGQQYARIDAAWAVVEANLAADPTLEGTLTVDDGGNILTIEQDSSYIYFSRPAVFEGQYDYRFRVGNTGLEFSTDSAGTTWNPVGGGASGTDLGNTSDGTTVTITSSTGNDTILSGATGAFAGVLTASDKTKLDDLENFSGEYTGNFTLRKNTDSYNIWVPSDSATTDYVTQFQSWGTDSPFGSAEHQYDVNFKADGVYHQDVAGSGAERRLAFADELGGGGSSLTPTSLSITGIATARGSAPDGTELSYRSAIIDSWFADTASLSAAWDTINSTYFNGNLNQFTISYRASSSSVNLPTAGTTSFVRLTITCDNLASDPTWFVELDDFTGLKKYFTWLRGAPNTLDPRWTTIY